MEDPDRYIRMALESDALGQMTPEWTYVSAGDVFMLDGVVSVPLTYKRGPEHSPNNVHYTWYLNVQFKADTILLQDSLRAMCGSYCKSLDSLEAVPRVALLMKTVEIDSAKTVFDGRIMRYMSAAGDTLDYGTAWDYVHSFVFRSQALLDKVFLYLRRFANPQVPEFEGWLDIHYAKLQDDHVCISTCDSCGGDGFWYTAAHSADAVYSFRVPNWCDWASIPWTVAVRRYMDSACSDGNPPGLRVDTDTKTGFCYMPRQVNSSPRRVYMSVTNGSGDRKFVSLVVSVPHPPLYSLGCPATYLCDSLQFHGTWPPTVFPKVFPK